MLAVLAEAAGQDYDSTVFDGNAVARQLMIDHLESLGFIEAHCGSPESGEDGDLYYVDRITSLGRATLTHLQNRILRIDHSTKGDWMLLAALILIVALVFVPSLLFSQEAPTISTDRPGQTTPPGISTPGNVQFEVGAHFGSDRAGEDSLAVTTTTLIVPGALIRIGVLERMELRIGTDYRSVTTEQTGSVSSTVSGSPGISIGTKLGICSEDGLLPETSALITLGLPEIGSEEFRPVAVAPSFAFLMRNALSSSLNLYYNIGGAWNGAQGAGIGTYSVLLSPAFTPSLYGFVEVYGALGTGMPPAHAVDAGVAYVVMPNLQLDLFGGVGITPAALDFFVHGGVSLRLPR